MEARRLHEIHRTRRDEPRVVLGGRGLRRGLLFGIPISLALWAGIIAALVAIAG